MSGIGLLLTGDAARLERHGLLAATGYARLQALLGALPRGLRLVDGITR
jgi:hypothetical protein